MQQTQTLKTTLTLLFLIRLAFTIGVAVLIAYIWLFAEIVLGARVVFTGLLIPTLFLRIAHFVVRPKIDDYQDNLEVKKPKLLNFFYAAIQPIRSHKNIQFRVIYDDDVSSVFYKGKLTIQVGLFAIHRLSQEQLASLIYREASSLEQDSFSGHEVSINYVLFEYHLNSLSALHVIIGDKYIDTVSKFNFPLAFLLFPTIFFDSILKTLFGSTFEKQAPTIAKDVAIYNHKAAAKRFGSGVYIGAYNRLFESRYLYSKFNEHLRYLARLGYSVPDVLEAFQSFESFDSSDRPDNYNDDLSSMTIELEGVTLVKDGYQNVQIEGGISLLEMEEMVRPLNRLNTPELPEVDLLAEDMRTKVTQSYYADFENTTSDAKAFAAHLESYYDNGPHHLFFSDRYLVPFDIDTATKNARNLSTNLDPDFELSALNLPYIDMRAVYFYKRNIAHLKFLQGYTTFQKFEYDNIVYNREQWKGLKAKLQSNLKQQEDKNLDFESRSFEYLMAGVLITQSSKHEHQFIESYSLSIAISKLHVLLMSFNRNLSLYIESSDNDEHNEFNNTAKALKDINALKAVLLQKMSAAKSIDISGIEPLSTSDSLLELLYETRCLNGIKDQVKSEKQIRQLYNRLVAAEQILDGLIEKANMQIVSVIGACVQQHGSDQDATLNDPEE